MATQLKTFVDSGSGFVDISSNTVQIQISKDITKIDSITVDVVLSQAINTTDDIKIEDELTNKIFAGKVAIIDTQPTVKRVTIFSYGYELLNVTVQKVYLNQSPEAIVSDLITNFTGLTYASTGTSGVTVSKFVVNGNINDSIKQLADALQWQYFTDANKNFYFQAEGTLDNGQTIDNNIASSFDWTDDPSSIINRVLVTGSNVLFSTTESFTGDGTTTDFVLAYNPQTVKVVVDGVEKTGGAQGQSGIDYYVDAENKKISFTTAPINSSAIVVDYNFNRPIFIDISDVTSISQYGEKSKSISAPWITTFPDARTQANGYLAKTSQPSVTVIAVLPGFFNFEDGERVYVNDTISGRSGYYIIQKVAIDYNAGTTTVTAGDYQNIFFNWQQETQLRLDNLEKSINTSDVITTYNVFNENLGVTFTTTNVLYSAKKYDSFVIGLSLVGDNRNFDTDAEWNEGVHNNTSASGGTLTASLNGATWTSPTLLWSNSSFFTTLENFNTLNFNGTWAEVSNTLMTWAIANDTIDRVTNGNQYLEVKSTSLSASLVIERTLSNAQILKETLWVHHRGDLKITLTFSDLSTKVITTTGNPTVWTLSSFDTTTDSGKTITKIKVESVGTYYVLNGSDYQYFDLDVIHTEDTVRATTYETITLTGTYQTVDILKASDSSVLQSGLTGASIDISSYSNLEGNDIKIRINMNNGDSLTSFKISWKPDLIGDNSSKKTIVYSG